MHNEFQEIEEALRRLKPSAPSEFCRERIAAQLDAKTAPINFAKRNILYFAGAAAAACVAVLVATNQNTYSPATAQTEVSAALTAPQTSPATVALSEKHTTAGSEIRRTLSGIEPLDIRQSQDGRFYRPYRVQYVDTQQWPNSGTAGNDAIFIKSTPTEEVRFVPVDVI